LTTQLISEAAVGTSGEPATNGSKRPDTRAKGKFNQV
jgi:hypothetical protein